MMSRALTAGLLSLTVAGLCTAVAVSAGGNVKPSGTASLAAATSTAASSDAAPSLHVSGNHLVNARGQRVVLHGVDRSGGEYTCVSKKGGSSTGRWTRRRSPP
jgi:endoglucanase